MVHALAGRSTRGAARGRAPIDAITVCPWPPGHRISMINVDSRVAQDRSFVGRVLALAWRAAAATTRRRPRRSTSARRPADHRDHRDRPDTEPTSGYRDAAQRRRPRRAPRTAPPPESQPGGAGDEVPAQTLALFTGRGRAHHAARGAGARRSSRSASSCAPPTARPYALRFGDADDRGRRTRCARCRPLRRPAARARRWSGPRRRRAGTGCASRPPPSPARRRRSYWLASQLPLRCAAIGSDRGGEP